MSARRAVCLVIDGLRASALGAYGNTSCPTPHLDALAGRAAVADWLWSDSPELEKFYRSAWWGAHAARVSPPTTSRSTIDLLLQNKTATTLFTDDLKVKEFAEQFHLESSTCVIGESGQGADEFEETALACFFAHAIEKLDQWHEATLESDACQVMWFHTQGITGSWDAPIELREDLLDEDDPAALETVESPTHLCDIEDPDLLLGYRVAYAAQVMVLDRCLGAFLHAFDEISSDRPTLFMLLGSRGFALGEHGEVGSQCDLLFSECLHLPWIIYHQGDKEPRPRLSNLAQPADIGATLLDWFGIDHSPDETDGTSLLSSLAGPSVASRQGAVSQNMRGATVLRTPQWLLSMPPEESSRNLTRLFSKPDDRWESNDVADRCPEIVDELIQEVTTFLKACQQGQRLPTGLSSS